jgi:hypothetical protein
MGIPSRFSSWWGASSTSEDRKLVPRSQNVAWPLFSVAAAATTSTRSATPFMCRVGGQCRRAGLRGLEGELAPSRAYGPSGGDREEAEARAHVQDRLAGIEGLIEALIEGCLPLASQRLRTRANAGSRRSTSPLTTRRTPDVTGAEVTRSIIDE